MPQATLTMLLLRRAFTARWGAWYSFLPKSRGVGPEL